MKQVAFGKYTLLHRIARGGMAELFLAQANLGGVERMCVVKLVSSHYAKDPSFSAMFEDEVRIAACLNHPNIGLVLDVGQVAGNYYLAMEHIHGRDLRAIVRRCLARSEGAVPPAVAVQIGVKICSALGHAHEARAADGSPLSIIHRDVSPSNIMVTFDGQVKLIDFGIAKAAGRTALTLPGTIKGKIRYLSPEQITGKDLDGRSDLFTLGTSLWEATVGRHLFTGTVPTQIYEAVIKGPLLPPSRLVPGYPKGLESILLTALARSRDERFASARAMQNALEQFAASAGIALDDLALSEFMSGLFGDEISRWREAQREGQSLLTFLQSAANAVEHRHDLDDVLSLEDERTTIPERSEPAPRGGLQPEATTDDLLVSSPASPTDDGAASRPTLLMGSAEQPEDRPRRTVLYGALDAPPPRTGEQPPPRVGQSLSVSEEEKLAITPGGGAEVIIGQSPDAEARRPTVLAESLPPGEPGGEDQRRTVMEDWSQRFASQRGGPSEPDNRGPSLDEAIRAASPAPERRDAEEPAPEPIVARDRAELAAKRLRGAELPELDEARKRTRTGDWAAQATARGEGRAGTHPFFKEARSPVERDRGATFMVYGGRRVVLIIAGVVLASAAVVTAVWWLSTTPDTPATPVDIGRPAVTVDAAPPDTSSTRAVQLASEPPGATAYSAADGRELGRTPFVIRLVADETREVQLRLNGYRTASVKVSATRPPGAVKLQPLKTDASAPRRRRPRPGHPLRKKTLEGDVLQDPFGK